MITETRIFLDRSMACAGLSQMCGNCLDKKCTDNFLRHGSIRIKTVLHRFPDKGVVIAIVEVDG